MANLPPRVRTKGRPLESFEVFNIRTSFIKKLVSNLFIAFGQLCRFPPKTVFDLGGGYSFSKSDVTRLRSEATKLLDQQNKEYSHAHFFAKKEHEKKKRVGGGSFNRPVTVSENAMNFFRQISSDNSTSSRVLRDLNYKFWENNEPATTAHLSRLFNNYVQVEQLSTDENGQIIIYAEDGPYGNSFATEIGKILNIHGEMRTGLTSLLIEKNSSDLRGESVEYKSTSGQQTSKPMKDNSDKIFAFLVKWNPGELDADARALGFDNAESILGNSAKKAKLKARVLPRLRSRLSDYMSEKDIDDYISTKYVSGYEEGLDGGPGQFTLARFDIPSLIAQVTTKSDTDFSVGQLTRINTDIATLHRYSAAAEAFDKANKRRMVKADLKAGKNRAGLTALGI
uniref:Uncharacterized protein n=1 Tax=Pithovirus LCPAC403 TaxID=2506596 RepID=A0A481ZEK4_9VIRU|nr:MAG: hypothetical protein LCPAC403_01750 [Pithovirus LCPAC403]